MSASGTGIDGPRIGVIGAGAVGGFYGLMLARAGFDVHFLLRSDYEAVRDHGLLLRSARYGEHRVHPVNAYRNAAEMPPCDWLLVGAKATDNAALAPAVAAAAAPGARVVLLQNGLSVEEEMRPLLPATLHLLGGVCMISVHRNGPGVIEHHALGSVILGYHCGPDDGPARRQSVLKEAAALFAVAGIETPLVDDLEQARWQKLVMNVPYNGLSVLLGCGTQALLNDPRTRALVRELMEEVIAGAAACGHPVAPGYLDVAWAVNDGTTDYKPSMLEDYEQRRPLELGAIFAAPLAAANRAGLRLHKIEMLHQTLSFLDERNRRRQLPIPT